MTMLPDVHMNRKVFPTRWILVVEDNIEMQSMLLSLLRKRYGSEGAIMATAVSSARHAVALLQDKGLVDRLLCILADHDTQWGTGSQLLEYLKMHKITSPICSISGIHANNVNMVNAGANEGTNKLDFVGINNFLSNVEKGKYVKAA